MRGNGAEADKVICPYFLEHGLQHIQCEGIVDGCRARFQYTLKKDKDAQMYGYCMTYDWKKCEYALALELFKYGEENAHDASGKDTGTVPDRG